MADSKREPNEADGPLIQAAFRRAKKIDEAPTSERRRRAWLPFLGTAVVAFAEGWLRETMGWGAFLVSLAAIYVGATAGDVAWAVPLIACGVVGAVLPLWAIAKRWPFGRQWMVLLGVPVVQFALMIAQWRIG